MEKTYDVAVIGAGPGGYVAAIRAAQLGLSTAIVERNERLGGTCLNIGCIPSKALLDSSEFYASVLHDAEKLGVRVSGAKADFPKMMARKREIVERFTGGIAQLMKMNGIDVVRGEARLTGPGEITVSTGGRDAATVRAKNIILASGSEPRTLPFLPVDGKIVITSTEALELESVPEKFAVVGAGAIGLELGSVYARLGSEVTVLEVTEKILPGWDGEVADALSRELTKQGMKIHTSVDVKAIEIEGGGAIVSMEDADGKREVVPADRVLVSVGRKPCVGWLEGGAVRIELDEKTGRVKTDGRFRTSAQGVYAIGDLVNGPMLAHKAEDEGMAAAEIIAGKPGHVNYGAIPGVVYTFPEAASVGRTEGELAAAGRAYKKGVFPFRVNGRALAMGATAGFVKVLSDDAYDTLLGVHIVGPKASELIAEAVTVMEFGGSAEDIARTVHAHPTLSEALREAALGTDGRMLHAKN